MSHLLQQDQDDSWGGNVVSHQGVDHRRPGNAALTITTNHQHLRLMSGTPAAQNSAEYMQNSDQIYIFFIKLWLIFVNASTT